ncbi:MAG: hypothetical protein HFJ40_08525 [Clostridia bacterium]|nr:hypothetical protein [Clostridia bacterium]
MNNIIRFYNQNRKSIWIILLIIFFLFLILQLINNIVGKKLENESIESEKYKEISISNSTSNTNTKSNKSVVTGDNISSDNLKIAKDTINEFMEYCSQNDIEKGYDMLTEECRQEMFNSIDLFNEIYLSKIPKGKNINCTIDNWINNTYKVKVIGDILSIGKTEEGITDYITIRKVDGSYKLNINSYIGRTAVNKSKTKDNVEIEVLNKDTYMDYDKYRIKIYNKSDSDIFLDTREDMQSMYIQDKSDTKYYSYTHELTDADLTVDKGTSRMISVKYYSSYSSNKKINKVVFSKIIMDYDSGTKIKSSKNIEEIGINI